MVKNLALKSPKNTIAIIAGIVLPSRKTRNKFIAWSRMIGGEKRHAVAAQTVLGSQRLPIGHREGNQSVV
jgi:hypothetical protein